MEWEGEALPVKRQVYTCTLTWWIYAWTCLVRVLEDLDSVRQTIKSPFNHATEDGVILHWKWGRRYPPWHTNKLFTWFTSTLLELNGNRMVQGVRGFWCKRKYSTCMAARHSFFSLPAALCLCVLVRHKKQRSWLFLMCGQHLAPACSTLDVGVLAKGASRAAVYVYLCVYVLS